jgi:hypothetical protein
MSATTVGLLDQTLSYGRYFYLHSGYCGHRGVELRKLSFPCQGLPTLKIDH